METIISVIGAAIIIIGMCFLFRKPKPKKEAHVKNLKPGECPHTSNRKMKVTSMGDREDYYLCRLCGQKVKVNELYYFEKGGI